MSKDNKKEINPKRAALIALSAQAVEFRDEQINNAENENEALFWATRTINYILLNHLYATNGATEFNTFNQWKEQGATVKKGEKAFLIWGQPIRAKAGEPEPKAEDTDTEADKYKYFPLCYLFSDVQVQKPTDSREAEPAKTPEEEAVFETVDLDDIL